MALDIIEAKLRAFLKPIGKILLRCWKGFMVSYNKLHDAYRRKYRFVVDISVWHQFSHNCRTKQNKFKHKKILK